MMEAHACHEDIGRETHQDEHSTVCTEFIGGDKKLEFFGKCWGSECTFSAAFSP